MTGDTGHSKGMRTGLLQVFGIGRLVIANISSTGEYVRIVLESGEAKRDVFYHVSEGAHWVCSDSEWEAAKDGAFGRGMIHTEASKGTDGKFNGQLELADVINTAIKMFRRSVLIEKFCACLSIEYADTLDEEERESLASLESCLQNTKIYPSKDQWSIILRDIAKRGVEDRLIECEHLIISKLQTIALAGKNIGMELLTVAIKDCLLPLAEKTYSC